MDLPESMVVAATAYGGAVAADNILSNPGFEQAGQGARQEDANDDWDNEGVPTGWSAWVRPQGKPDLPLSKAEVRPQAGRNRSTAVALSAGTGGAFISTRDASPGATYLGSVWLQAGTHQAAVRTWCRLIFKDDKGQLMSLDDHRRVRYEDVKGVEAEGWQRLAVCAKVPPGAAALCLMFGHDYADAEVLFDDAMLLLAASAPVSSDFEAVLAEGAFRERCRGRLSGRGVAGTDGRNGGTALRFTPGPRGESSFVKIVGIADELSPGKAMTIEAWIQVDPAYEKGAMELVGNPVTDRGEGFRLYLDRAGLHFVSGTGGVWQEAKTWGAHSGPEHPIEPGRWHHVAGSYDGSVFRVFIDGQLAGSSAPGMPLTRGKPDICIGSFRDGLVLGFGGRIADVNIDGQALPEAEIRRRANRGE